LAAAVDVVIENFSAGVMDRLELGYESLKLRNPALIYVSMSGYGHNGPRRDWTSMNMNLQGYSGLMMVTGGEGDPPTAISNSWNDYVGGLHACFAILQAIDKRLGTGEGTLIDLSQFECSVAMIGSLLLKSAVDGKIPPRLGNRSERFAPQGVYRCSGTDQWCALSVETDEQWKKLARMIGHESWTDEPRFSTAGSRSRHHDEIDRAITAWTVQLAGKEIEQQLNSAEIPAERVRRIDEVVDSADACPVFDAMSERRVGSMRTTRLPFSLSSVDLPSPQSAPSLGEHSAEVLREWLHYSNAEIEDLRKREALQ